MRQRVLVPLFGLVMLLAGSFFAPSRVEACHHNKGRKGKHCVLGCQKMLLKAPLPMLKVHLKLDEKQAKRFEAIRDNCMTKSRQAKTQMWEYKQALKKEIQGEAPDQDKVLDLMRKVRWTKGRKAEERVKAVLKMRALLTPDQQQSFWKLCPTSPGDGPHRGCPHCGGSKGSCPHWKKGEGCPHCGRDAPLDHRHQGKSGKTRPSP